MRTLMAAPIVLALAVAACGAEVTTPEPEVSPSVEANASAAPTPGRLDVTYLFDIVEVGVGATGYVTLRNFTDTDASLGTLYLCQADGCVDLPDVAVPAGEVIRIAVGDGSGLEDVAMTNTKLDLSPPDGEVAVFASSDTGKREDIRAYLQWGSTPHDLTHVAVDAGLWLETAFAPSGPDAVRLWRNDSGLWLWDAAEE
jgi:hypothetical protein